MTWQGGDVDPHDSGERVTIGPEFEKLILAFGRPGVIRGQDHRGLAFQEVREFNFADWPEHMPERDRKTLRKLVHTPQWALISGNGMKAAQPVTGKWVRAGESDFERLSRMAILGEVRRA